MSLAPGSRVGPYEIEAPIGAGGMGEVYRARDTRLNRAVALKIVPDLFARDAERLQRFEREAQTLAALNHPHIAQIHGLEESGSVRALVMELIAGESLAARLTRGRIPVDEALPIARQIIDALEAAHEKNIIHRDLKPANVMLTPNGAVKVLDFGLAKTQGTHGKGQGSGECADSPTITTPAMTEAGVILGTAAYMSPEQARGKVVDRRSDIWAFGVVLFEMLTARPLFAGETTTDVLAAIVREKPDWTALPPATPVAIRRLLRRCLEVDPARRLRHIGDALFEIDEAIRNDDVSSSGGASPPRPRRWALAAGIFGLAAAAASTGWLLASRSPVSGTGSAPRRFQLPIEKLNYQFGSDPAISRDGRRIAYKADGRLWIRDLNRLEPIDVRGSDGGVSPFWSPDGRSLAFGVGRKLVASTDASAMPMPICDLPDSGQLLSGAWNSDGTVAFSTWRGSVYSVPARGGAAAPLVAVNPTTEIDFHDLWYLPGGVNLLFATHLVAGGYTVESVSRAGRKPILEKASAPMYSQQTGQLLHLRQAAGIEPGLWAVPLDARALQVTGSAVPVERDVSFATASEDGTLVVRPFPHALTQLIWVDRSGRQGSTIGEAQINLTMPALSPDGRRVAVAAEQDGNVDIWIHEVDRGTRVRLTVTGPPEVWPGWSPRGDRVVFMTPSSTTAGTIFSVATDGGAAPSVVATGRVPAVTGDGRHVVYLSDSDTGTNLSYVTLADPGRSAASPRTFLDTPARENFPAPSPDGQWVAYVSDTSGRNEVYVSPFPEATARVLVSRDGGTQPRWRRDGRELYFQQGDFIMAADIDLRNERAVAGAPRKLFSVSAAGALPDYHYDVAADGQRFVLVRDVKKGGTAPTLVVIENWFAEFAASRGR